MGIVLVKRQSKPLGASETTSSMAASTPIILHQGAMKS
jgi:hypothetical protein